MLCSLKNVLIFESPTSCLSQSFKGVTNRKLFSFLKLITKLLSMPCILILTDRKKILLSQKKKKKSYLWNIIYCNLVASLSKSAYAGQLADNFIVALGTLPMIPWLTSWLLILTFFLSNEALVDIYPVWIFIQEKLNLLSLKLYKWENINNYCTERKCHDSHLFS